MPAEYLCERCFTRISGEEWLLSTSQGGASLCSDCMDILSTCNKCDTKYDRIFLRDVGGELLCPNCHGELEGECTDCQTTFKLRDLRNVGDRKVCTECLLKYPKCGECGERHNAHTMKEIIEGKLYFCIYCLDNITPGVILPYNYRVDPIFYSEEGASTWGSPELHLGVELEIGEGGNDPFKGLILREMANVDATNAYIKHDGSVREGFEIVTHPATLGYHMKHMPYRDVFKRAIQLGYTSHTNRTCGLHVHVGRKGLGTDSFEQDLTIMKILYTVEKHWDKMVKFSRRTQRQINEWASNYLSDERTEDYAHQVLIKGEEGAKELLDRAKSSGSRYKCINLRNCNTIEFRFFRGTLKYNTFIATLQFVDVLCRMAKSLDISEVIELTWSDIVYHCRGHRELLHYLVEMKLCTLVEGVPTKEI